MRILSILGLLAFLAAPAAAQDAQSICQSLNRPNVDCSCVSKRFDAYKAHAQTDRQRRLINALYRQAHGLSLEGNEQLQAMYADQQAMFAYIQHFDAVGGAPENIDDFNEGCAIAGAAMATLPDIRPEPPFQKLYKACMDFAPDQRGCQCSVAKTGEALTVKEATAYYYSFNERGGSTREELDRYAANKSGLSLDSYRQIQSQARTKLAEVEELNALYCSAVQWADGREGRSAALRAGPPIGFEETAASSSAEAVMSAGAARSNTPALPKAPPSEAFALPDAADPGSFSKQGALALVKSSCSTSGETCACKTDMFETDLLSKASSDGTAMQLAVLYSGGDIDPMQLASIVQSVSAADQQAATQIFMGHMMSGKSCD